MSKTVIPFEIGSQKYRIEEDALSWRLKREQSGGGWIIVGYYSSFDMIAKQVYDLGLRDSGASTFAELLKAGKELRAEVRSAFALWDTD